MKTILLKNFSSKKNDTNVNPDATKVREKILKIQTNPYPSNIIEIMNNHTSQVNLINKLYLGELFEERKFIISELKCKINSYKQQDIKKNYHESDNLITIDNVIEKLVCCKLKCYYCNEKIYIIFEKVRDNVQWTLDRLNNYDEHTNDNTIICCLQCNLQRRRKNSDKFKFTKQLETNQIRINKID